jgi:hypothetical protein
MLRCASAIIVVLLFTIVSLPESSRADDAQNIPQEQMTATVDRDELHIGNDRIAASWRFANGQLTPVEIVGGASRTRAQIDGNAFVLVVDGRERKATDLQIVGGPQIERIAADPSAVRKRDRLAGVSATLQLRDPNKRFDVNWRVIGRDATNYLRQELTVRANDEALPLQKTVLIDCQLPGATVVGDVKGSPIAASNIFCGVEHPMSVSSVRDGRAECSLEHAVPLRPQGSFTCSSVIGVAGDGQLRRDFLAYIEQERPRPYRPFLHYNSWYDLRAGPEYTEATAIETINACGRELVTNRGVTLSSFLFDDGWDDQQTLWAFNSHFPHGFAPLAKAAAAFGAAPGVWLSPWGGYGKAKQQRLAFGQQQGFEVNDHGFALSGPNYFKRFEQICLDAIKESGVNQFKFDGTADTTSRFPTSEFGSDFDAVIQLIQDLRRQKPDVYVNVTTGTWPSPFWLLFADSIWRGGADNGFAGGVGSDRQQWITFRDATTYRNIVQKGPLYPLNSLMLHGIITGRHAGHLSVDPNHDLAAEAWSYFGSGTQCQELYITPERLSAGEWDTIAEAARWARDDADTLADTHWIGGDPGQLQAYGWASWSPRHGILAVRNPSDKPSSISIDVAKAFELPTNAPQLYRAAGRWRSAGGVIQLEMRAGVEREISLAPFEVVVVNVEPVDAR